MVGAGRLLSDGAPANGVVIGRRGPAPSSEGAAADVYQVTVRVRFGDGSTTQIEQDLSREEAGLHTEGDILPVRYDPADRSHAEIDVPKLTARREARPTT